MKECKVSKNAVKEINDELKEAIAEELKERFIDLMHLKLELLIKESLNDYNIIKEDDDMEFSFCFKIIGNDIIQIIGREFRK